MKPYLQFSVPCLDVNCEGNVLDFKRVFFDLPSYEFPTPPFEYFYIANSWVGAEGSFETKIRILDPEGHILKGSTFSSKFYLEDPYVPFMTLLKFENIIFSQVGYYTVEIYLDDELKLAYKIELRRINS